MKIEDQEAQVLRVVSRMREIISAPGVYLETQGLPAGTMCVDLGGSPVHPTSPRRVRLDLSGALCLAVHQLYDDPGALRRLRTLACSKNERARRKAKFRLENRERLARVIYGETWGRLSRTCNVTAGKELWAPMSLDEALGALGAIEDDLRGVEMDDLV